MTPKAPPAPPKSPPPPVNGNAGAKVNIEIPTATSGVIAHSMRAGIYGPGGVGKSELASLLKQVGVEPLFVDLESGSHYLNVARVEPKNFDQLRAILQGDISQDAVVVDTMTKAEEFASNWVIDNVPHEKGPSYKVIKSIEDYGFGKGLTHIYEALLKVLSDLDSLHRRGKHVICIAHDCTAGVPNPSGEDWIRYEPRLQSPPSGKASIRHRFKEWCDHLFYVGFDTAVSKDGKASGHGTRTIYCSELPTFWAKSRLLADPIPYARGDAELWRQLLDREN